MVFQIPTSPTRAGGHTDVDHRAARVPQSHDLAELKAAPSERWLDSGDAALKGSPNDGGDFDIIAWFAVDEDESGEARGMTECWYG